MFNGLLALYIVGLLVYMVFAMIIPWAVFPRRILGDVTRRVAIICSILWFAFAVFHGARLVWFICTKIADGLIAVWRWGSKPIND